MNRACRVGLQLTAVSPAWYLLVAGAVIYGLFSGGDTRNIIVQLAIVMILISGLNFIAGYGGMPSLAQAGLFGVGAYTAAISDVHGVYSWVAFILGPIAAGVAAALVGAVSLHLRGMYFIMATLGAGLVVDLVATGAVGLTGGPNGLLGVGELTVGSLNFGDLRYMYVLAALLAVACVAISERFERSKAGLALRAMSHSEPAAMGCGVSAFHVRLTAFILSGIFAGLAGSLETFYTGFISPSSFTFLEAVLLLAGLVLGGLGRVWGSVIGAVILVVLQQELQKFPAYQSLLLGIIFVIIVQRFPEGIAGGVSALARYWKARWIQG